MKNLIRLLSFIMVVALAPACEKHVVEYNAQPVAENMAEFQLHYFVPVTTGAANNIYKVEVNGKVFADSTNTLSTYNAIPSGGVGRFFTANPGATGLKLYKGGNVLVYDQNCNLKSGKQNVFVYDFNKPPIVFDNGFPYPLNITQNTDSTSWVKFYNFLYEKADVTTDLKLQYQYRVITGTDTAWINVGKPVAFGEATGWEPVKVIKSIFNSSGYATIYYRLRVIGSNGSDQGSLKVRNSSGSMVDYSDFWTTYIGRACHHVFAGMRAATPISSVRLFYAR
ncbi:hypothetical protein [Niabella drilacis]|uniref:Uncharacterized protein n=1 Tax=Niabella drilacis (strain DSM 25811 / CCM 8410 / CCUG 62505 / LMG 26954 / E90) TaxID=1285928 RepID=A0A1G7AUW7_NIADE|nr:hypothetical protein [Niabella drilacis]SDE18664.1 hypothetical protein SAMN04487894_12532 [Niabella drilacis]